MGAQEIADAYQSILGRAGTQAEIDSEIENEKKYGHAQTVSNLHERAGNYTGDRNFDSQGPMYDQRTNQLSAAGQQATQQLRARQAAQPRSLASLLQPTGPMRGPMPGQPGTGPAPGPTSYGNDTRSYPMPGPAPLGGAFSDFTQGRGPVIGYGPHGEPLYAPVSTTMPVGQRPQLANLL